MGSTESTLPSMEDTNSASANHNLDDQNRVYATTHHQQRELRRETDTSLSTDIPGDDPWWWEIENENLILDRVPNVTSNSDLEEENAGSVRITALTDDFNTSLKIGENVNISSSIRSVKMENLSEIETVNSTAENVAVAAESSVIKTEYSSHEQNETRNYSYREEERDSSATQSLAEFKEELRLKRMARQTAVQDLRDEIATLRKQLTAEQELTRRLRQGEKVQVDVDVADEKTAELVETKCPPECSAEIAENVEIDGATGGTVVVDEDDENVLSRSRHANIELANAQLALQLATSENISMRAELGVVQKQVGTLKEVVACCKQMLAMKEDQCTQLKTKLDQIEESFGEREMKIMSDNLRQEYERQLGNIRQLRQLYEERQRIAAAEHENLQRLISIKKDELTAEQERTKSFEERNQTLLKEVEAANNELAALREECNEHKFEKKTLKEEMGAVNTLFSQMVMGFNGKNNLDIDRLATMLEENRTLLNDMATKEINCSDGATLPKLLFELVEQAAVGVKNKESRSPTPMLTGENDEGIVNNGNKNNDVNTLVSLENSGDTIEQTAISNDAQSTVVSTETTQDVAGVDEFTETDNSIVTSNAIEDNETANININSTDNYSKKQHQRKSAVATNNSNNAKTKNFTSSSAAAAAGAASSTSTFKLHEPEVIGKVASTQEIIGNLPKVWKVLMELLSHHKIEQVQFEENGASEDCYKSVETPNGPKAELSVSKTYIKLKDLILEKKSLVKETNRLKTLNCHLDYRLNEQEKRLSAVSLELTKTWHLVGKMQRQHRQLHTQEQILRYQLQQKRRLLSELKDELEYCRRKWAAARAKNDESQEQYNDLRREFAKRKLEDANNSAESGYSDSGPPSDEEERGSSGGGGGATAACSEGGCYKRDLRKTFEHSRKIKRMQSTSPGRAVDGEIELRWNSAPPTCGWRAGDDDDGTEDGDGFEEDFAAKSTMQGAVPKSGPRTSRSKQRMNAIEVPDDMEDSEEQKATNGDRAVRIQRLEEQCKTLIQQVLETSDNRERLEIQLCRFQDEIAPVQYAIPLEEFISKKRLERMTRASSAPATPGTLTPREEEYTRKRSERLGRLEEESRQLISRIKRTTDRGHYLRCSLDRLHKGRAAASREGSFESNTEEDAAVDANVATEDELRNSDAPKETSEDECASGSISSASKSPLTAAEEAYTARRAERLKRLEAESKQLLNRLSHSASRSTTVETNDSAENDLRNHDAPRENSENDGSSGSTINSNKCPLTAIEEAYTARRTERLKRLEAESKQLLSKLTHNANRGGNMTDTLDALHAKFGNSEECAGAAVQSEDMNTNIAVISPVSPTIEKRIENIERMSTNRDERLRILEEEGKQLISRLSSTSARGTRIINRIAEREQSRLARQTETPTKDVEASSSNAADSFDDNTTLEALQTEMANQEITEVTKTVCADDDEVAKSQVSEDLPSATVADAMLPALKNVACSSIVSEELAECVTVTTTPSQIAGAQKGAIPKSKPLVQLSAAKVKTKQTPNSQPNETESLEQMVNRLKGLPFPDEDSKDDEQKRDLMQDSENTKYD